MKTAKLGRMIRAGAAALLCAALCGCSVKVGTNKEPKSDLKVAYATKGEGSDELYVTYGDFAKEYKYYLTLNNVADDTASDVADNCKGLRSNIIQYLVNEKIIFAKAKEMGIYDLTAEETAEVEKAFEESVNTQIQYYSYFAAADYEKENSGELTEEQQRELGEKMFNDILEKSGVTRDDIYMWEVSKKIAEKLKKKLGEAVEYSEAVEKFADFQKTAEEQYKEDPTAFAQQNMDAYWLPEGARYVKHILLQFDTDTQSEIRSLRSEGKDSEADKLREDKAKELESKRAEVQKKLDEGADFDEMMKEYSAEQNADRYPNGYTVLPDGGTFVKEFQDTAMKLRQKGDIMTCVTDYGIHIMLYYDDAKLSEETLEQYTDLMFDQLKELEYTNKMTEWGESYEFKFDYDALRIDAPEEE